MSSSALSRCHAGALCGDFAKNTSTRKRPKRSLRLTPVERQKLKIADDYIQRTSLAKMGPRDSPVAGTSAEGVEIASTRIVIGADLRYMTSYQSMKLKESSYGL